MMTNPGMRTIGFFGGSYNPVHWGHLNLARAIVEAGIADEVWLSLSPLNPFKADRTELLADDADRLAMLRLGAEGIPGVKVTDIELSMPRPSYTIDTLRVLAERHPDCAFRIIIGSDNIEGLPRWKEADELVSRFTPIVYPRPGYPAEEAIAGLPVSDVSSTEIRERLAKGEPVNNLLPSAVLEYIRRHSLYGAG